MNKHYTLQVFITAFFILICAQNISATTYFVAQKSSGDGSGKSYAQRMSVADQNSAKFSPGDVVFICGKITSRINITSSGTADNYITYRGDHPDYPSDINFLGNPMFGFTGSSYLILNGLRLRNGVIGISTRGDSNFVIIRNCKISNMTTKGIYIGYEKPRERSTGITIGGGKDAGNEIYDCGQDTGGMDISLKKTDYWTISYNKLFGTGGSYGIDGITTHMSTHGLIEYNHIYSHHYKNKDRGEDGIDLKENTNNVIIRYNHIYDHARQSGITVQRGSREIDIYGNSIYGSRWAGVLIKKGSYDHSTDMHSINIFNNLIYDNGAGVMIQNSGTSEIEITGVHVYNNTIVNNGGTIGAQGGGVNLRAGAGHLVKNNIFYGNDSGTNETSPRQQLFIKKIDTASVDGNQYFHLGISGKTLIKVGSTDYTLEQFKALGQEANGHEGDPMFVDIKNNNFRLSTGSPCVGTGVTFPDSVAIKPLDPLNTDFEKSLNSISAVEIDNYVVLEKGAFIYNGSMYKKHIPSPKNISIVPGS